MNRAVLCHFALEFGTYLIDSLYLPSYLLRVTPELILKWP